MYVKIPNPPVSRLRVPGMSEKYGADGLDVPESGVVQVDKQTGEALLEHLPDAKKHEAGDDS
jgi:hypothetical protein